MNCRHCNSVLNHVFVDLVFAPISNDMLTSDQLYEVENYYPLKVFVCHHCFLVQLDEFKKAENIFNGEYTYFSSFSKSWLKHAENYVEMMMDRFKYDSNSKVLEIASNDGYLLQYFVKHKVPVLGVDPTTNTAIAAAKKGVKTIVDFFSSNFAKKELVDKKNTADLIIGNNVLAHVTDINDFVKGMKLALNENGVITMEFPHLLNLIENCEFDTIYHEHFSYLSIISVKSIFEKQGLSLFDVEEIPTHGGSLRIFAKHTNNKIYKISKRLDDLLNKEIKYGLNKIDFYSGFQEKVNKIKYEALSFLINERKKGKKIIGYGAASKGNTFLNYCGIKGNDLIKYVVDASPYKQDKYLPGSHIPVVEESHIKGYKPDYIIILPWNLEEEISQQLSYCRKWGAKFVIFIPELAIF